ncbi:MAG: SPFH domain-containing protein [Bacillota bacterium]
MFGFNFIKFQPNEYVLRYRNGKIVSEGQGLSFFYYAPATSLVVIPMGSIDAPFIFEELTADFQTVTIQGQVTYRIVDQRKISQLLNYTLDLKSGGYQSEDPDKLSQRIINLVKVLTKNQLKSLKLREALKSSEILAEKISEKIKYSEEIELLGIEILELFILAIKPDKETSRALEAEAREEILKKADDAIYGRRNSSIEQERKIRENELNTEIAVENKKRQIKETQMEADRIVQQKEHELQNSQMIFEIEQEEKRKQLVNLSVENAKTEADAKAYELAAVMKGLEGINPAVIQSLASVGMEPDKLIAMAFQELAGKAEKIGQLNVSPDLMRELLRGVK